MRCWRAWRPVWTCSRVSSPSRWRSEAVLFASASTSPRNRSSQVERPLQVWWIAVLRNSLVTTFCFHHLESKSISPTKINQSNERKFNLIDSCGVLSDIDLVIYICGSSAPNSINKKAYFIVNDFTFIVFLMYFTPASFWCCNMNRTYQQM